MGMFSEEEVKPSLLFRIGRFLSSIILLLFSLVFIGSFILMFAFQNKFVTFYNESVSEYIIEPAHDYIYPDEDGTSEFEEILLEELSDIIAGPVDELEDYINTVILAGSGITIAIPVGEVNVIIADLVADLIEAIFNKDLNPDAFSFEDLLYIEGIIDIIGIIGIIGDIGVILDHFIDAVRGTITYMETSFDDAGDQLNQIIIDLIGSNDPQIITLIEEAILVFTDFINDEYQSFLDEDLTSIGEEIDSQLNILYQQIEETIGYSVDTLTNMVTILLYFLFFGVPIIGLFLLIGFILMILSICGKNIWKAPLIIYGLISLVIPGIMILLGKKAKKTTEDFLD